MPCQAAAARKASARMRCRMHRGIRPVRPSAIASPGAPAWALLVKPSQSGRCGMQRAKGERVAELGAVLRRRTEQPTRIPRLRQVQRSAPGVMAGAMPGGTTALTTGATTGLTTGARPAARVLMALLAGVLVAACHPEPRSPPREPPSLPSPRPGPSKKPTIPPGPQSEVTARRTAVAAVEAALSRCV